ncbi:MAG: ATP-binding protein, partial [Leptospira sp.]|nr:ATP-binding protein [Leptospira sp.]
MKIHDWLVNLGQPGIGKSSIYKELIKFWSSYPNRFVVIQTKSFRLIQTRTNVLMKRMIKAINPDEHAPGDIETRYEVLRNCLVDAHQKKKKVILLFDEAQDLNGITFRELKKLHELSGMGKKHLFSIVMFAKNINGFENLFANRELGHRLRVVNMK